MKIIFISYSELSDKVYYEYFLDKMMEDGIDIEYWNISQMVRERGRDEGEIRHLTYYDFDSFELFSSKLKLLESIDNLWILINFPMKIKYFRYYRILSCYNFRVFQINNFARPVNLVSRSILSKMLFHSKHPSVLLKILSERLFLKLVLGLRIIKKIDLNFTAGDKEFLNNLISNKNVNINSYDFERSKDQTKRLIKDKYAVFLDVYLPFHNDHVLNGIPAIEYTSYYDSLNLFFDRIERNFELNVVICSHPTAINNEQYFQGRRVVRMRTMELTRHAEFCISHHSSSLSYAVIFKKPIIFVYTDIMADLYANFYMRDIIASAEYLRMPILNVDREDILIKDLSVEEPVYLTYIHNFIASTISQNSSSGDIILNELYGSC